MSPTDEPPREAAHEDVPRLLALVARLTRELAEARGVVAQRSIETGQAMAERDAARAEVARLRAALRQVHELHMTDGYTPQRVALCTHCQHPGPCPTYRLCDRALAAPPKGGKNRFEVQYICCGKEDGVQEYATWEDAHAAREAYLTLNAHESHNRSAIIRDIPRNQQAPASGGEK